LELLKDDTRLEIDGEIGEIEFEFALILEILDSINEDGIS